MRHRYTVESASRTLPYVSVIVDEVRERYRAWRDKGHEHNALSPELGDERTYAVQSGDIAADIAASFGITLEALAAANDTTVDDLRELVVGDLLIIPLPPAATPEPAAP